MAPHSSTPAWKIPWMEEPGRLQSMGSRRVRRNWETSLSLLTFMHWRKKWQPTRVFLPGESQGWGSLVGCRLWESTELDRTEATQQCVCFQATLHFPHPLLPGPAVSTTLFSVHPWLPCKQVHQYHLSRFHTSAFIWNICFSLSDLFHSV